MKPAVPETARVIRLEGDMAVVLLEGTKACKGCGAAAMGLCKPSGSVPIFTVSNTKGASPGNTVTLTLNKAVQRKGFLHAYFIPVVYLVVGTLLGHIANGAFSIPSLDVLAGFAFLGVSSAWSLRKLGKLNKSASMTIKEVVSQKYH